MIRDKLKEGGYKAGGWRERTMEETDGRTNGHT